jgi:alkylation response protein AidB-like acyl-CoA dehydrogenase
MLADMATQTEVARSVVYRAAEDIDQDPKGRNNKLAAIAKLFTSEMATQVALLGVQILGGYGYIREFEVERLVRDAKLMEIGAGTSEVHRMIIAREMLRSGKGA